MMQIGELAQKTQLSLRTIRHYDDVGLLKPSGRSEGGFRLYTGEDLEKLLLIRRMRPLDFTLDEMRELLELVAATRTGTAKKKQRDRIAELTQQAEQRRAKLADYLVRADELLAMLGDL